MTIELQKIPYEVLGNPLNEEESYEVPPQRGLLVSDVEHEVYQIILRQKQPPSDFHNIILPLLLFGLTEMIIVTAFTIFQGVDDSDNSDNNIEFTKVDLAEIIAFVIPAIIFLSYSIFKANQIITFPKRSQEASRNEVNQILNEPVADEYIGELFENLNRENTHKLSIQQFSTALRTHFTAAFFKFGHGDFSEEQSFIYQKMETLRDLNEEKTYELIEKPETASLLIENPHLFIVVRDYLTHQYPLHGNRILARLNLIESDGALKSDHLTAENSNLGNREFEENFEDENLTESSSSTFFIELEKMNQDDAVWDLDFANGEKIDNVARSNLKALCHYFNTDFLSKKRRIDLSNLSKEHFDLLIALHNHESNILCKENVKDILAIASFLGADAAILQCITFLSEHISELDKDELSATPSASLIWKNSAALSSAVFQRDIQDKFIDAILNSEEIGVLFDKIKVFFDIFCMPNCYSGVEVGLYQNIHASLDIQTLSAKRLSKYLTILKKLPQDYQAKCKTKINQHINRAIIKYWTSAEKNNYHLLKQSIIRYCLSDEGCKAKRLLLKHKHWWTLPSELIELASKPLP